MSMNGVGSRVWDGRRDVASIRMRSLKIWFKVGVC